MRRPPQLILADDSKDEVAEQARQVVADAVEFAESSPDVSAAAAETNVYSS